MQQLQHIQFTMQNELTSFKMRYCYVPAGKGFAAIDKNTSDKIRSWFKRNEA